MKLILPSLFLALAYFITGRLGLMLPAFGSNITLIWLPTGIAVAGLLRWGFGCWPGVALGAAAVNFAIGSTLPVALAIAVGNTLGPLLAAWLLRRAGLHPSFDRVRDILLLTLAAILGMMVSSTLGVTTFSLAGVLPDGRVTAWLVWWAGDTMGVIASAPLVLAFTRNELRAILFRGAEFAVWLCVTALVAWGVFVVNQGFDGHAWALAFLPLPMVAWAALRYGPVGTSVALIVTSVGAAYGTATGHGPFFRPYPTEGVVVLWVFMATAAALGWLISALHTARVQATGVRQLFEGALSDVSLGVLLAGLDRRITYANQGFTRLTGYTEAEMLGKSCALLHGPETAPDTVAKLKAALHGDAFFDGEILNYRKDGTPFWNALLISPVRDERGVMTGFLGIQSDVTTRKRAEIALQQSAEHLRQIIELEPECVKIVSPEGTLLEMNPAGLAMIDATSFEEVRGCPLMDFIVPENRAVFAELHQRAMAGGTGRCEFAIKTLKGTPRWLETHAVPYRNGQHKIIGVLGITRDVTQRRETAAELERSLTTLQLFIDTVPAYISFVDADERYVLVNRGYEEYFGKPASQIVGQRLCDAQTPAAYAEMQPHVRAVLAGQTVRFQSNPASPDGKSHWFDVQYVPRRGEGGAVLGFFVLVFDISEQKQIELALRDSRSRLDGILNDLHEVVYSSTADGSRMLFISASAEDLYGHPVADFMADPQKWFDTIHPGDRAKVASGLHRLHETGSFEDEYRIVRPDGTVRWVHDRGAFVPDESGLPLRLDGIVTDITERRQAADRLRDSEVRYRQLFEANPHPMWVYDLETLSFLAVNAAAIAHYGYSREEFLAMTIRDIRPPEDIPALLASVANVTDGRCEPKVWRHRKRDGTIIDVEISFHVLEFDGRRAEVVLANDVTERRRAEIRSAGERAVLELLASGAPLAAVLDRLARSYGEVFPGMLCSVLLLDPDGRHLRHGAAPGLPAEFCRAIDGVEIGPSVGSCGTAAFTRQTTLVADIATDPLWRDYRDLALANGLRACWSVPVISSQDRVLGTLALYYHEPKAPRPEEISAIERGAHFTSLAVERHELLQSLRESEASLQAAQERAQLGSWEIDLATRQGWWSREMFRIFNLEPADAPPDAAEFFDLLHPEDQQKARDVYGRILQSQNPQLVELRSHPARGPMRYFSANVTILPPQPGRAPRAAGTVMDVTATRQAQIEREQLDRKVQETQKLESLGVLAGGIAHDFNNLLTTILGNASLAEMDVAPGSPTQECLAQITEASLRAADLCKQMLAYSGRGRFVVQKLDLGQLVEQTAQMLQISISKKAVLRFRLEKGLPPVEVDATQIRQVIMNLVINASEAIGDKSGVISISTGLTRVDRAYFAGTLMDPDLPEGEYVFLEVSDTGSGMSPETQAKIFDPFFTTKFTGRGLGLAAVLGIVRGHKGAMKVYSELGRGTTFKLLFPAASVTGETSQSSPPADDAWQGKGTVLVVDDEETMRSTVARMLRHFGIEPVLVSDGREAVEVFRADPNRFDLVLLDLTMPHMDGEQTFTELRRILPEVRVVLMSGFNAQEAMMRFTGKGLASFLQKPFAVSDLRTVLQTVRG
ncbi:MAG: PAS domain S-box protein [Chthoniobacteraceae bacterium]